MDKRFYLMHSYFIRKWVVTATTFHNRSREYIEITKEEYEILKEIL